MVDARTLLILASVAELMLAVSMWVGMRQGHRDGIPQWAGALAVRALALGVLAGGFSLADGALAVAGTLIALSFTLQAAALMRFDRRSLPAWVHPTAIAGVALPLQLLAKDAATAALFGGLVAGCGFAALAAMAWHFRPGAGITSARAVATASLVLAAAAVSLRGIGAALEPDVAASLATPSGFASGAMVAACAAFLASSLGFILMHHERAHAQAARLETLDPLTGACNRHTFHEAAERELARARRSNQPLSIVLLDVDHFNAINEEMGHAVGDEVLTRVAQEVRAALRQEDMLVRFGGDELLVLLPGVPGPGAVVVAGRIRRNIAATTIEAGGKPFNITVSVGVAARLDEGPESVQALVGRAGSALALAQERGRNRVVALSLGRAHAA